MRPHEIYVRTESGYEPANQVALDAWRKDYVRKEVWLERKSDRNPRHHNKFFALLSLVVKNSDQFQNENQLRHCIMAGLNRGQWFKPERASREIFIPDSISFGEMGQDEFDQLYREALAVIDKHFLPDCAEEIQQQILRF